MMMQTSRPLLDALRYAVRTLQADPDALTPKKSELLQQLRGQVEELEAAQWEAERIFGHGRELSRKTESNAEAAKD